MLLPLLGEFVLCWEGVALLYSLLDGSCWVCLPFMCVGAIVDWSRVGEGKKSMKVHIHLMCGGRDGWWPLLMCCVVPLLWVCPL